jgi:hypothetical protein
LVRLQTSGVRHQGTEQSVQYATGLVG